MEETINPNSPTSSYEDKIKALTNVNEDLSSQINELENASLKLNNDIEVEQGQYKEMTDAISKEENALDKAYFTDQINKEEYQAKNELLYEKKQSPEIKELSKNLFALKKDAFATSQKIALLKKKKISPNIKKKRKAKSLILKKKLQKEKKKLNSSKAIYC